MSCHTCASLQHASPPPRIHTPARLPRQVAKVYLSVYSDDAGREQALIALQRLEG
jgi:hypothetical protein